MKLNMITVPVKFGNENIQLHFKRQMGNSGIPTYDVRSDDNRYLFSITHEAGKFKVYNVKSDDSSNLFFDEMTSAIDTISNKLIL